jgi:hypothetical protein
MKRLLLSVLTIGWIAAANPSATAASPSEGEMLELSMPHACLRPASPMAE